MFKFCRRCYRSCVQSQHSIPDREYFYFYHGQRNINPNPASDSSYQWEQKKNILSKPSWMTTSQYYYTLSFVWLVLLTIVGLGLIMYGVFQEEQIAYKKLNVGVGLILILCMLMFVSFLVIDTKRLRKYILHILVPWCAGITLIMIGILVAFVVQFINFKLFLITTLPLSSLAFFTFNEIYHYIGRMRVTPLHSQMYRTPRAESEADARRMRTSSRLLHFRPDTARPRQQSTVVSPTKSPTQPGRPRVSTVTPARTPTTSRAPPPSIVRSQISSRPVTTVVQQMSTKKPVLPPLTTTSSVNPASPASRLRVNRTPEKQK